MLASNSNIFIQLMLPWFKIYSPDNALFVMEFCLHNKFVNVNQKVFNLNLVSHFCMLRSVISKHLKVGILS